VLRQELAPEGSSTRLRDRNDSINFVGDMQMKVIHLIAATAALAMSTLGFAEESRPATGIYVGLEGGSVSYAVNDGNDGPSRDEYVESARAGAVRLSVGYQFTPNFSLESGYFHLGDFKREERNAGPYRWHLTANTHGFDLLAIYKLTEFIPGLYLKGGLMHSQVSLEAAEDGPYAYRRSTSHSQSGIGYQLGIGYEYDLTSRFSINGAYTRLQRVGGSWEDGVSVNANLLSAGLKYRF